MPCYQLSEKARLGRLTAYEAVASARQSRCKKTPAVSRGMIGKERYEMLRKLSRLCDA